MVSTSRCTVLTLGINTGRYRIVGTLARRSVGTVDMRPQRDSVQSVATVGRARGRAGLLGAGHETDLCASRHGILWLPAPVRRT